MTSLIALLAVVLTCAVAVPAGASPIQDAPAAPPHSSSAPVIVPAPGDGTDAIVYVLIGAGAVVAFGAGGFMGARSVQTRRVRPSAG